MANVILIQDLFEGMPDNTDIAGRIPPITESGYDWQRETAFAGGDGAGNIKWSAGTAIIKMLSLTESVIAGRAIWNDGGADNGAMIFLGDYTSATVYPRNAYAARFFPRTDVVAFYRIDNFISIKIGSDITGSPWNALGADNTFVFQRNVNTFEAMVNGAIVGDFTDATYSPNGTRRRHGFGPFMTNQAGRLRSFELLDSVTETAIAETPYTIIEVF